MTEQSSNATTDATTTDTGERFTFAELDAERRRAFAYGLEAGRAERH